MPTQQIHVRPLGGNSSPTGNGTLGSRYTLSNFDVIMPRIYIPILEVFELPPNTDKDFLVGNLMRGLQFALSQYPPVTGVLHTVESTRKLGTYSKCIEGQT